MTNTDTQYFEFEKTTNLEKKIFDMYQKEINNKKCSSCLEHDRELKKYGKGRAKPGTLWYVGKNFDNKGKSIKLFFIGKTGIGTNYGNQYATKIRDEEKGKYEYIQDCRYVGPLYFYFPWDENGRSRYWDFIKDITYKLGLSLEDIAISNLAKCNCFLQDELDSSDNNTDRVYFDNCKRIINKEIKILKPTHVIFFTGAQESSWSWDPPNQAPDYDVIIKSLEFEGLQPKNIFNATIKVKNKDGKRSGTQPIWWWRTFYKKDKPVMHFLRTYHPARMPDGLKNRIYDWIVKETKI